VPHATTELGNSIRLRTLSRCLGQEGRHRGQRTSGTLGDAS